MNGRRSGTRQGKRTLVHASLAQITNRRRLDHVTDGETLDGLVFGDASRAVRAADKVDVAAAVLVASVVSSLLGLNAEGSATRLETCQPPCVIQSPASPSNTSSHRFLPFHLELASTGFLWAV